MKPQLVKDPTVKRQPRKRPGRHAKRTPKHARKQSHFSGGRCR